jgi:GTP diphosphokinase / guanosine-3',5'-bis(diphosphate) 3'-diphosphatase
MTGFARFATQPARIRAVKEAAIMMRQYELTERVLSYNPKADEALLNRAYVYAMKAHGPQKRRNGDPYFSHPLEVAAILTELKLDDATIATALLHDVIEDTTVTKADIDKYFGAEIAELVEGLTKIGKLDLMTKKAEQAENFRKLLLAISSDVRVLLVKLADRLHNMRTLEHNSPESRQRNSEETLEIYAPLAGRMGMQGVRDELEELSFKWLNPEGYATVTAKLAELRRRNGGLIDEILLALKARFAAAGIAAEISGREKKPYSIWRKMENRQISLEQLSDIYAFRVSVASHHDCYRALGLVHGVWRAVPGRFKDYISTPKQNNYQSIHTTIVGPRNQRVELQIRTLDMHGVAEYGIAAHALYKDGLNGSASGSAPVVNGGAGQGAAGANGSAVPNLHGPQPARDNPYLWLRQMVESLLDGGNSEDFLEHTKLELFHDQVFSFTPKGRIIALPRGATPIDFAYAVHTDVGNGCIGALVNGRQMPLTNILRNGDEVVILTAKGHVPPAAWEKMAVTGRARAAIRRASRDAVRRQFSELGRRLALSAAERAGLDYQDDKLKRVLTRLGQKTVEDVHTAIARNELKPNDVLRAMFPEAKILEPISGPRPQNRHARSSNDDGWFNLSKVMSLKFRWPGSSAAIPPMAPDQMLKPGAALPIRGLKNDVPVIWEEGGAVPGDRIVGVLDPEGGIRIFQIHSPKLAAYEHERWIDVTWDIDPEKPERFPAKIMVTILNVPLSLAQVAQVIGEADGNIDNLRMTGRGQDFTEILIELEVWDATHLNIIVDGLKAKPVVSNVERRFD